MTPNDVIEETLRTLLGGSREEMNKLSAPVSTGATALSFQFPLGSIREGAQLGIGTEMYRVWSVDDSAQTALVEPGVLGSTKDSHSSGEMVYVNPRFPRFAIIDAIQKEIRSLSSPVNGLYRMYEDTWTADGTADHSLSGVATMGVYDVFQESPGSQGNFIPRAVDWTFDALSNSIHTPSARPGAYMRALFKKPFSPMPLDALDADLTLFVGLPVEMHDILALGVLLRLGPSREIKRNFTEAQSGDSRRADEVQAGSITNSFAWVRNQRNARITEERMRLEMQYPTRYPAK